MLDRDALLTNFVFVCKRKTNKAHMRVCERWLCVWMCTCLNRPLSTNVFVYVSERRRPMFNRGYFWLYNYLLMTSTREEINTK